jgi:hypothetical protein
MPACWVTSVKVGNDPVPFGCADIVANATTQMSVSVAAAAAFRLEPEAT